MKTLYVSDLDGTLLGLDSRIGKHSLEAMNAYIESGGLFTYATARSLTSATPVTDGLMLTCPVVTYNGTFIQDSVTGKPLVSYGFSEEEIATVQNVVLEAGLSPFIYSFIEGVEQVSWIATNTNDAMEYYLAQRQGDVRHRPLRDPSDLFAGDVFYVACLGASQDLQPTYEVMKENAAYTTTLLKEPGQDFYWLEIRPRQASKANAVAYLKEYLGCDSVVVFGDAMNDAEMFKIADKSYAVANGAEELKSIATGIIECNDEDGVAKQIYREEGLTWQQ